MTLKEISTKIIEARANKSANVEDFNPRVRASVEGQIRRAEEDLPKLEQQYLNEVIKSLAPIVVTGDEKKVKEFLQIAETEPFKTITFDYLFPLNEMINDIKERGLPLTFDKDSYWAVLTKLRIMKNKYGMVNLPQVVVNQNSDEVFGRPIKTAISNLIANNFGNQLYDIVTIREVAKLALNREFTGKTLPFIIYNHNTNGIRFDLMPNIISTIDVNNTTQDMKAFVKSSLNEVKKILNPKKETKETKEEK